MAVEVDTDKYYFERILIAYTLLIMNVLLMPLYCRKVLAFETAVSRCDY